MAVIVAGLYKLDLFQTYMGEQILNTFWYRHASDDNTKALELAIEFDTDIMPTLAVIQNADLSYDDICVTPIFGTGVEVNKTPAISTGADVGASMPTFMCASIRLNRSTNELRNGWKRFAGLIESQVNAASFTSGYLAELTTLANDLAADLNDGVEVFTPQIVRKPMSTKAKNDFWEAIDVGSATALNRPTTQNTRKTF
ncbi:MAG: hypothetical protein [Circular genetic element sp.]|nr:MAG: hypothetical protein [Circular genetic element sp.]